MMPKNQRNRPDKQKIYIKIGLVLISLVALSVVVYFLPPVHERLSWRLANLRAQIGYFFNPPEELIFSPEQQAEMEAIVNQTLAAMVPSTERVPPSKTPPQATATFTDNFQPTPIASLTPPPTITPTPIPGAVNLNGVRHEYQKMNNCGPATLAMALSFWGWEGDQEDTRLWLRPHPEDRNVMPYEMVNAIFDHTDLAALVRWGGDEDILKQFIAAGFPVIIERDMGDVRPNEDWTGHFGVVTGYDDSRGRFILQDSYVMANYPLYYEDLNRYWRAFNYVYLVIYPPDRESEVRMILGSQSDEINNHQHAAQKAQDEIPVLEGRDLFFAWFNYGTSQVNLGDFVTAAGAYDRAYNVIYPTIPSEARPWRMIWYQTGPYYAYYHTGRYQDVINLADLTLSVTGVREIEETWVWRGRAKLALGDRKGAIEDFFTAINYHPGWDVAIIELQNLGIAP
jgi:hypothetical protein